MSETLAPEWTALVGRRDEPTDGVRDYCDCLAAALERQGIRLTTVEMAWATRGWVGGFRQLRRQAREWKGRWVLVQYTPLAWSRRGFSFAALLAVVALRRSGARIAVVFHDWTGFPGKRGAAWLRRTCQRLTMRRLAGLADRCFFPAPVEKIAWLQGVRARPLFLPIGANLPALGAGRPAGERAAEAGREPGARTVAVYGITGGAAGLEEVREIAAAVGRLAKRLPGLRLVVFGRGSDEKGEALRQALHGTGVELTVRGVLSAEEVARELTEADALLFVRGEMLGHRGSAIAGIACGIPVVGYGDAESAFPLSEGGVVLASCGDAAALADALGRVLSDESLWHTLRERSRNAQENIFSWDRIAENLREALGNE
jgi:glycosyltransferase involved in cell wall biosynthesis